MANQNTGNAFAVPPQITPTFVNNQLNTLTISQNNNNNNSPKIVDNLNGTGKDCPQNQEDKGSMVRLLTLTPNQALSQIQLQQQRQQEMIQTSLPENQIIPNDGRNSFGNEYNQWLNQQQQQEIFGLQQLQQASAGQNRTNGNGSNGFPFKNLSQDSAAIQNYKDAISACQRQSAIAAINLQNAQAQMVNTNGGNSMPFSLKICSNCGATNTPSWRRCPNGKQLLCNACGLYQKLHQKARPFCRMDDGSIKVQRQTFSDKNVCAVCQTNVTPLWRRGANQQTLCNACGLYYKQHRADRRIVRRKSVDCLNIVEPITDLGRLISISTETNPHQNQIITNNSNMDYPESGFDARSTVGSVVSPAPLQEMGGNEGQFILPQNALTLA